jgi:hypothetical protein
MKCIIRGSNFISPSFIANSIGPLMRSLTIILFTIIVLLLITPPAFANDKFWISNRLEVGYDKVFVSNQVRFDRDEFTRNRLAAGLRFKISDITSFKTFYLLENARKNNWDANHFLAAQFELKLQ